MTLEHLGDRRRRILAVLLNRSTPISVEELSVDLAENDQEQRALHIDLVHRHLPALVEADLLDWDRTAETVTTTDHPAFADPDLRRIIGKERDESDDGADCLADERRRTALAILEERGTISREDLARAIAEQEVEGEPTSETVEETLVALHHVHLPKLDGVGLVNYDDEAGTVHRS